MSAAAFGLVAVPSAPSAAEVAGPSAVAVASDGTSFAAVPGADHVSVLTAAGEVDRLLPLTPGGPVVALAVDGHQDLWVLRAEAEGDVVQRLDTVAGAVEVSFVATSGCDLTQADAATTGGLAVSRTATTRIFLADRCADSLHVLSATGTRLATVALDGRGRGVTWGPAQQARGAQVAVALPAENLVAVYPASLTDSTPADEVVSLPRATTGSARPRPVGVAADSFGQLAVLDAANNAVLLLDGNSGYRHYRTLGRPPSPGDAPGALDAPSALVWDGDLWVADTGNGRVLRWFSDGTARWATPVGSGPAATGSPSTTATPTATPTATATVTATATATVTATVTATSSPTRTPSGSPTASPTGSPTPTTPGSTSGTVANPCAGTPSVVVDGGRDWTRTRRVRLSLVAPADATRVAVAGSTEDLDTAATRAIPERCVLGHELDPAGAGAARTVWVRYLGPSEVDVADAIGLDTRSPRVGRARARWSDSEQSWVLRVRARDDRSRPSLVRYARTRRGPVRTYRYGFDYLTRDASTITWVKVVDAARNPSRWVAVRFG